MARPPRKPGESGREWSADEREELAHLEAYIDDALETFDSRAEPRFAFDFPPPVRLGLSARRDLIHRYTNAAWRDVQIGSLENGEQFLEMNSPHHDPLEGTR